MGLDEQVGVLTRGNPTTGIQNCLVDHSHLMSPIADWVKTQLE